MQKVSWKLLFLLTFYLCPLSGVLIAQQNQPKEPKIRYFYPAGGQQGTTFLVLVGGREITRSYEVIISGSGVRGQVLRDTLALHINDPNERQLIHQLYVDALRRIDGVSIPPMRQRIEPAPSTMSTPTVEDIMKKYPYMELLNNPSAADLELVYYYYFSPRLERKPLEEALNRGVLLEITIDRYAEPGNRDIRLLGPAGMTPPARFVIGTYPEVREQEPNETLSEDPESEEYRWQGAVLAPKSIRNRPPLELPVVINGQIHAGDVDSFQFKAKRGQKLVIDVQARRLLPYLADAVPGWFQAAISLFDSHDKKIAEAMSYHHEPDPLLLFEVPKDDVYLLKIHDSIFRGRDDFVYRITIAESPLVTSVFPLGLQRGRSQKIDLQGLNLPQSSILIDGRKNEKGIQEVSRIVRTWLPHPIRLAIDGLPEKNESEPNNDFNQAENIRLPIIINGRISGENDTDVFTFEGRKGEQVVLDVTARALGSPLDAMLELLDAENNLIASNDDRADAKGPNIGLETHHADPYLNVELPADGRYFVRLCSVAQRETEEYAYRLRISPPQPDVAVFCEPSSLVFRENVQPLKIHLLRKDGFNGEVRLRLVNSTDFRIENALVASNTNEAAVNLHAVSRSGSGVRELTLEAVAVIDGKEIVRPVVAVDTMEQAFIYRHWVPAKSLVVFNKPGQGTRNENTANPQNDVSMNRRPNTFGNPAKELNVSQHSFSGTSGKIDYCQAVENKDRAGEMSLVLILHGRSGGGDDNVRQLTSPAVKPLLNFVRTQAKKCVVIIPQCPADRDWVRGDGGSPLISVVSELVKAKSKEFKVSPNRIYLTGVSMGGGACYSLLAQENSPFTKAVVVSAGGRPGDAAKIKCDVYIVHGEQDNIIPLERARAMADAVRKNGKARVEFTVLPGKGHVDAADSAYSEKCWRWLFR
ncbi:MAG: pre-peptidase C-terminal domain-containing protein [Planctomycetaceae bacterium]|nr:pre-peptidase C-terminal domain-containing protein [Planctomycetaceae bacterium]